MYDNKVALGDFNLETANPIMLNFLLCERKCNNSTFLLTPEAYSDSSFNVDTMDITHGLSVSKQIIANMFLIV